MNEKSKIPPRAGDVNSPDTVYDASGSHILFEFQKIIVNAAARTSFCLTPGERNYVLRYRGKALDLLCRAEGLRQEELSRPALPEHVALAAKRLRKMICGYPKRAQDIETLVAAACQDGATTNREARP